MGQLVTDQKTFDGRFVIDGRKLASGIYTYRVDHLETGYYYSSKFVVSFD